MLTSPSLNNMVCSSSKMARSAMLCLLPHEQGPWRKAHRDRSSLGTLATAVNHEWPHFVAIGTKSGQEMARKV
jgi:hypothetical protein